MTIFAWLAGKDGKRAKMAQDDAHDREDRLAYIPMFTLITQY